MRYFLFILSAAIVLTACSKKAKTPTAENLLRSGKWKLSSGTITVRKPNGKDTTLDYMKFIPDCYKDDYLVFDSLYFGKRYNGTTTCNSSDPEYVEFQWRLKNNNTMIDLYNGFNNIYGVVDTVQPWTYDTVATAPYLVVDTVIGYTDTSHPPRVFIEIDTVRKLFFSGVPFGNGPVGPSTAGYDLYDVDLINLSSGSFTLHFQQISYYTDSTNWHDASYLLPLDPVVNPDSFAVIRPDTFNYTLNYTNF